MEIPSLSISNCLSQSLPKYSTFLFSPNPKVDSLGPILKSKLLQQLILYNIQIEIVFNFLKLSPVMTCLEIFLIFEISFA